VLDVVCVGQFTHGIDVALQNGPQKRADNRLYGRRVIGKGTGGKQSGSGSCS
jgi:hypothetical protein